MEVLPAVAAWAINAACGNIPTARDWLGGICPRRTIDIEALSMKLSPTAKVHQHGSAEFNSTFERWSQLMKPGVDVVVVPATPEDVSETVKYANSLNLPFIAYSGTHGAITTQGRMEHGIQISMSHLSSIDIADDGKSVKIGGGTNTKTLIDTLWDARKETVTGTCECVSYTGPALGGGHGWLQGQYGLIADQWISMDLVLADGSTKTIDAGSDLWWGTNGAGHNFGIVTSVTAKIYERKHEDWALETFTFSGDKVETLYEVANEVFLKDGSPPSDVINWSYWLNIPDIDPENPIIFFYVIQEGVKSVDKAFTKPFYDLGPLAGEPTLGTYKDLAAWTVISNDAPPCQNLGLANPRFPAYLKKYDGAAMKKTWDLFASAVSGDSPFSYSIYLFEGYPMQGVQAIDDKSSAFPYRGDNLLTAPLVNYIPGQPEIAEKAAKLGNMLRGILNNATGHEEMHAYINYAFGDETPREWYGHEDWRQERLISLKKKYDPKGKFSFYGPIM